MDEKVDKPDAAGDKQEPAVRRHIAERFNNAIVFNRTLNIELLHVESEPIEARVAYRPEFLGDAAAGLWHTSVATALADSACGLAVFLALPGYEAIATLDLRMDYLRPAIANHDLYATAECHHMTRSAIFAHATIHQGDGERPTARCTAVFVRTGEVLA